MKDGEKEDEDERVVKDECEVQGQPGEEHRKRGKRRQRRAPTDSPRLEMFALFLQTARRPALVSLRRPRRHRSERLP